MIGRRFAGSRRDCYQRERKSSDSPAVVNDSVTSTACSELDVFPGGMCALVGTSQRVHRGR